VTQPPHRPRWGHEGLDSVGCIFDGCYGPSIVRQKRHVVVHRLPSGVQAGYSSRSLCPGDHAFAGFVLSLLEIEDCHTVRVRDIVGRGYGLDGAGFIADVVARNPLAGPAGGLAVTEVQSVRLERSVIGLAVPR